MAQRRVSITGTAILESGWIQPEGAEATTREAFKAQGWNLVNFDYRAKNASAWFTTVQPFSIVIEALVDNQYSNQEVHDNAARLINSFKVNGYDAITNLVLTVSNNGGNEPSSSSNNNQNAPIIVQTTPQPKMPGGTNNGNPSPDPLGVSGLLQGLGISTPIAAVILVAILLKRR